MGQKSERAQKVVGAELAVHTWHGRAAWMAPARETPGKQPRIFRSLRVFFRSVGPLFLAGIGVSGVVSLCRWWFSGLGLSWFCFLLKCWSWSSVFGEFLNMFSNEFFGLRVGRFAAETNAPLPGASCTIPGNIWRLRGYTCHISLDVINKPLSNRLDNQLPKISNCLSLVSLRTAKPPLNIR